MMNCLEVTTSSLTGEFAVQVVETNNGMLFISGVLPLVPDTDRCVPGGVGQQMEQALENLRTLLNASYSDLEHLVSIQILIPDRDSLAIVNDVYRRKLMDHKVARSVIPCGSFHPGALVEINAVAMVSPERVSMRWCEESAQPYLLSA
jgi:2-iminobutanoate/2-iminopropanoate deaminase